MVEMEVTNLGELEDGERGASIVITFMNSHNLWLPAHDPLSQNNSIYVVGYLQALAHPEELFAVYRCLREENLS